MRAMERAPAHGFLSSFHRSLAAASLVSLSLGCSGAGEPLSPSPRSDASPAAPRATGEPRQASFGEPHPKSVAAPRPKNAAEASSIEKSAPGTARHPEMCAQNADSEPTTPQNFTFSAGASAAGL